MFFSLCFMTEIVVIVLSLKCKSKNSIFEKFHLKENSSYNDDSDSERFSRIFETFDIT